jgi:2-oxo-4-hydroxy-4-carboxy-5-ureidoimidazoline decarboxylase
MDMHGADPLASFNQLPADRAVEELMSCCASVLWATAVAAGRPYFDVAALTASAGDVLSGLGWPAISDALAAHPRIGQRPTGAGREAAWSRREQAGVTESSPEILARLAEANRAYEDHFGHVFLIFASGRTDIEMLAAARQRLCNDDETERAVVRGELAKIVTLRLERLLA